MPTELLILEDSITNRIKDVLIKLSKKIGMVAVLSEQRADPYHGIEDLCQQSSNF